MHHPVDPDIRTCRANPASYHRFRPKSGKQLCFHCWNKLSCTAIPILGPLLGRGFDKMRPELTIRVRLVHAAPNLRTLDSVTSCANGAAAWGYTGPRITSRSFPLDAEMLSDNVSRNIVLPVEPERWLSLNGTWNGTCRRGIIPLPRRRPRWNSATRFRLRMSASARSCGRNFAHGVIPVDASASSRKRRVRT
jgi:hypothetical protein